MVRTLLRLLVTIAAAALPTLLALVKLPGWDDPDGGATTPPWLESSSLSVGALGLDAVLVAFVVVELVAAAIPRWRALRFGAGRVQLLRVVMVVAAALVLLQALYAAWAYRSYLFGIFEPGLGPLVLDALALVGGVLALLVAARAVTRFGIGHGLSVVVVLGALPRWLALWDDATAATDHETFARTLALVTIAAIVLVGREVRGERLPVPGLVPLLVPAWVTQLVAIPAMFVSLELIDGLLSPSPVVVMATVGVLAIALPWLGQGDRSLAVLWDRRTALLASAAMLLAIAAVNRTLGWGGSFADIASGLAYFVIAVACTQDVLREVALTSRVELVPVLAFSDIGVVDRVSARLTEHDIAHVMRAVSHRTLLRFFGPWVPVKLLVERGRAEEARRIAQAEANREAYAEIIGAF